MDIAALKVLQDLAAEATTVASTITTIQSVDAAHPQTGIALFNGAAQQVTMAGDSIRKLVEHGKAGLLAEAEATLTGLLARVQAAEVPAASPNLAGAAVNGAGGEAIPTK